LKFKPGLEREHSDIVGLPTLDEFTICFWINSGEVPTSPVREFLLLEYVNQGLSNSMFQISTLRYTDDNTKMKLSFTVSKER
jgi:hypothetical protein